MAQLNVVARTLIRIAFGTALPTGTHQDALQSYIRATEINPKRLIHRQASWVSGKNSITSEGKAYSNSFTAIFTFHFGIQCFTSPLLRLVLLLQAHSMKMFVTLGLFVDSLRHS